MQNFISIRRCGWSRRIPSLQLTVRFLSLSFFGLFVTRTGRTGGPILTIYTSYDVFLPKDVPFGGFVDMPPHLGGQIHKKKTILGAWIGVLFQPNWWNRKTYKTTASIPTKFCTVIKTVAFWGRYKSHNNFNPKLVEFYCWPRGWPKEKTLEFNIW